MCKYVFKDETETDVKQVRIARDCVSHIDCFRYYIVR